MHHHYNDIISRIQEKPEWWDENGVPRYGKFSPDAIPDIYADEAVLLKIRCQQCHTLFDVSLSSSIYRRIVPGGTDGKVSTRPKLSEYEYLGYGDPPNSGCCAAGPTMTSETMKVLQFWERSNTLDWVRKWGLEREYRMAQDGDEF